MYLLRFCSVPIYVYIHIFKSASFIACFIYINQKEIAPWEHFNCFPSTFGPLSGK